MYSQTIPGVPPYWKICAQASEKIARGPPLGGMLCSDGLLWLPLCRCAQP